MRRLFNWLSQVAALAWFNLSTIPQRRGSVAAALFGIAGVVAVFVGTLSIAEGFRQATRGAGSPEVAIVMRGGSDTEMVSILGGEETRLIADAPGIARDRDGPLASAELFAIINLPKRSTGTDANVPLRGVGPAAFRVRDGVRLIAGRKFDPGRNEVIVGRAAAAEFTGLDLGGRLRVGKQYWRIVGIFATQGGLAESEIWTGARVFQGAYQRGNSFQSVLVRLRSPAAFEPFRRFLEHDPRLGVKVLRQDDYYREQSQLVSNLITGLGTIIAGLMAVGAVFGALNTMYSAVAARSREIATLRALGFHGGPILCSIILESALLALAAGMIGGAGAYVAFDGFQAATMNWQSFSQVAFAFDVTPKLLLQGMACAGAIGLIGGLFPALRAARMPVVAALRES
jgi:putative ABC transport system permease protein